MEGVKTVFDVLVAIEALEWLKKDMHYRTNDEFSYALHLLADKIDFGDDEDDLKECYFLGFKAELPPTEEEIHKATALATEIYVNKNTNRDLLQAVIDCAAFGVGIVEKVKKDPLLPGGVQGLLDKVSETMLRAKALAWMSLRNPIQPPKGKPMDVAGGLVKFLGEAPAPIAII